MYRERKLRIVEVVSCERAHEEKERSATESTFREQRADLGCMCQDVGRCPKSVPEMKSGLTDRLGRGLWGLLFFLGFAVHDTQGDQDAVTGHQKQGRKHERQEAFD